MRKFLRHWVGLIWLVVLGHLMGKPLAAQVVQLVPSQVGLNDSVTILYNASLGNAALANFQGDVYLHTGLILPQSNGPNDWYFIVGRWGQVDSQVLMTRIAPNLYSKRIHLASFYNCPLNTQVNYLAFVFRNANGTLVGRSSSSNDILVPLTVLSPGTYLNHWVQGHRLTLTTTRGTQTLDLFQQGLRVHYRSDTLPQDSSYAVLDSLAIPKNWSLQDSASYLTGDLQASHRVIVFKNPLRLVLLRNQDTLFSESPGWEWTTGGIKGQFALQPGEVWSGGGFRTQDFNLRGKRFNLYNQAQYGYGNGAMNLNISVPFWVSSRGYGLLLDNHRGGIADLGQSDPTRFTLEMEGGPARYWLVWGSSYQKILERLTGLTGRQELPPRWSLGYIQSRYGYQTENEARSVVTQMVQQDFPLSALVLDLYWFGTPATMGNLQWDYTRFPTPVSMMQNWRTQGIKTILITETYFTQTSTNYSAANTLGHFARSSSGQTYNLGGFWAGTSALLDLTKPAARSWFMDFYTPRINEGVEGWWCDLGEPESHPNDMVHAGGPARSIHNLYSLLWAEALHSKYKTLYPQQRLFNLIRSGYTGMQRYSTFPWTGDIQRSWSGLQAQIPAILGMGMSGIGYMHSDIGGFTGGGQNDELYARWQQFGAFQPIQRVHGEGVPTEPFYYPVTIRNIVRDFAKIRMRLMPYNYTLAWENSTKGLPLMRPLIMHGDSLSTYLASVNDQYLWGNQFMVAPVLQSGQSSRQVVVPPGKWFDWWTDQPINGGSVITAQAPLNRMPLYVRGDAFVPMAPAVNSADRYLSDTLEFHYYPADSMQTASYTLFLDDGNNRQSLSTGQYKILELQGHHSLPSRASLSVTVTSQGSYVHEPALRNYQHIIHRTSFPSGTSVHIWRNQTLYPLYPASSLSNYRSRDSVYWYDSGTQTLSVKYTAHSQEHRLQIGAYTRLDGRLTYANAQESPLVSQIVQLHDTLSPTAVLLADTTDSEGRFGWRQRPTVPYLHRILWSLPWGGCNATDALLVARHAAGILNIQGLALRAADVNRNQQVNATDALLIQRRVAGLSTAFASGDWVHETLSSDPLKVRALCAGDVNASLLLPTP